MSECGVDNDSQAIARWNKRSDATLLTMQRERDKDQAYKVDLRKECERLIAERDALKKQLAASERTCAELRAQADDNNKYVTYWQRQATAYRDELSKLRARAEAAELKNNPTKE